MPGTPGFVRLPEDGSGKRVDANEMTRNAVTVERQVSAVGDATSTESIAAVQATVPVGTEQGLVVRLAGGLAKAKLRNLAGTVTAVKASAGQLHLVHVVNNQAAAAFVQIFDQAAASVTLATTTPDFEVQVPANSTATLAIGGAIMTTAISVASTTAEFGNTGSATGVQVFVVYA